MRSGVRVTYERLSARFAAVQDQLVELSRVGAGDRVLDLASGTGEVAPRGGPGGRDGIDISEPMLVKAREVADAEGVDITFDLGDVEYLPYDDACSTPSSRTSG